MRDSLIRYSLLSLIFSLSVWFHSIVLLAISVLLTYRAIVREYYKPYGYSNIMIIATIGCIAYLLVCLGAK